MAEKKRYNLKSLGHIVRTPKRVIETFPNERKAGQLRVRMECTEFTCRCPVTGQPDYATIVIEYLPRDRIIESKSFKLYLWTYRDEGMFHEDVARQIRRDIVKYARPEWVTVSARFNARGGIAITAESEGIE